MNRKKANRKQRARKKDQRKTPSDGTSKPRKDRVQIAGEDSFPASDPPAFTR